MMYPTLQPEFIHFSMESSTKDSYTLQISFVVSPDSRAVSLQIKIGKQRDF